MPFKIDFRADDDVLDAIGDELRKQPALVQSAVQRVVNSNKKLLLRLVQETPGAPTYPFVWSKNARSNARARGYYFGVVLKGKKRKGGRYQRTGKMQAAWRVETNFSRDAGAIFLTNNTPGVRYVQGDRQIFGHRRTGWTTAETAAELVQDQLTDQLIDAYFLIADPTEGF